MTLQWFRILAAVLGGALALWLAQGDTSAQPEGAMGSYPLPDVVGMSGSTCLCGHVLASATLEAALHEQQDGFFSAGLFSISVPPGGNAATVLRQYLGDDVEIVIRTRAPRQRLTR